MSMMASATGNLGRQSAWGARGPCNGSSCSLQLWNRRRLRESAFRTVEGGDDLGPRGDVPSGEAALVAVLARLAPARLGGCFARLFALGRLATSRPPAAAGRFGR